MKALVLSLLFFYVGAAPVFSQQETKLFVQGIFQIEDRESLSQVENSIRSVSNVETARLDIPTQRFFIIINGSELTEDVVKSWFGVYSETVGCIQIGIYGQDPIRPYPFTNCND